jgi:hypothetical protein
MPPDGTNAKPNDGASDFAQWVDGCADDGRANHSSTGDASGMPHEGRPLRVRTTTREERLDDVPAFAMSHKSHVDVVGHLIQLVDEESDGVRDFSQD